MKSASRPRGRRCPPQKTDASPGQDFVGEEQAVLNTGTGQPGLCKEASGT